MATVLLLFVRNSWTFVALFLLLVLFKTLAPTFLSFAYAIWDPHLPSSWHGTANAHA